MAFKTISSIHSVILLAHHTGIDKPFLAYQAMTEKLIIDTDPGIDDALAIACAFADPKAKVLALTTVFGNASLNHTTENALRILEVYGRDIPVYRGAHRPLTMPIKDHPTFVHGEKGLGRSIQPKAKRTAEQLSAAQFLVNAANQSPGEITIVALGPLTNLALALALDPTISTKIKRVVCMGGNLHVPGNVSTAAEANIFNDPHAADQVFAGGWPVSVVGLDVTHDIIMPPSYFQQLEEKQPVIGKFLNEISQLYLNFYHGCYGFEGCHIHDSSAIACALYPEWFEMETGQLRVICDGDMLGKLVMYHDDGFQHRHDPWLDRPAVDVAVSSKVDRVKEWMDELF